jgi:hypothetical protein
MERRSTRRGSNKSAFRTLHRSDFCPWDRFFRAQARASSPSRQVSPPFTCPVQPLKAAPRSGPGRLPKASRVRACEARPRAPHPTGSGYPLPIKLSLCPTSVTPLEAPLIGQDASRISEVLGTGIRNAKKFLASIYKHVSRARCGILHAAPQNRDRTKHRSSRFCEAALREMLRAASRPGHESGAGAYPQPALMPPSTVKITPEV